jgi:hypothetical protein
MKKEKSFWWEKICFCPCKYLYTVRNKLKHFFKDCDFFLLLHHDNNFYIMDNKMKSKKISHCPNCEIVKIK